MRHFHSRGGGSGSKRSKRGADTYFFRELLAQCASGLREADFRETMYTSGIKVRLDSAALASC